MSTLLKPILVRKELLDRGIHILTPEEFTRIFTTPYHQTKYFLEKQTVAGLFLRLKRGLYALRTDLPNEEEIANALYRPSYLSLEYALAHYGVLPEMPYLVTSITTKPTRLFDVEDKNYSYQTVKRKVFTGYSLEKKGGRAFLLAEPEKAVVDYLYFSSLKKLPKNERLNLRGLKKAKIVSYAKLFDRPALTKRIKELS